MALLRGRVITDRHSNMAVVTQWISHSQSLSNGHLGQPITLPKGPLLDPPDPWHFMSCGGSDDWISDISRQWRLLNTRSNSSLYMQIWLGSLKSHALSGAFWFGWPSATRLCWSVCDRAFHIEGHWGILASVDKNGLVGLAVGPDTCISGQMLSRYHLSDLQSNFFLNLAHSLTFP